MKSPPSQQTGSERSAGGYRVPDGTGHGNLVLGANIGQRIIATCAAKDGRGYGHLPRVLADGGGKPPAHRPNGGLRTGAAISARRSRLAAASAARRPRGHSVAIHPR